MSGFYTLTEPGSSNLDGLFPAAWIKTALCDLKTQRNIFQIKQLIDVNRKFDDGAVRKVKVGTFSKVCDENFMPMLLFFPSKDPVKPIPPPQGCYVTWRTWKSQEI